MDEAALPPVPEAPRPDPLPLCRSDELVEKGNAFVFDVLQYREPAHAFVMRFDGQVVAYLNRCLHVPTEMDWQYGEFLDSGKEFIMCSIHGAVYEPLTGRCAGGPCGRGRLTVIEVVERDGQVYWYPSRDTKPHTPPNPQPASA
jgi:nitrite reductase/ring-hydroxylating ferredoxin subunit